MSNFPLLAGVPQMPPLRGFPLFFRILFSTKILVYLIYEPNLCLRRKECKHFTPFEGFDVENIVK